MRFAPKKYVCSVCGKGFRRTKQHYNHVQRNSCGKNRGMNKKQVVILQQIEPELVSLKPELGHTDSQTTQYHGSDYNYSGLQTGNRHLRSGIPLPRLNPGMRCAI